MRCSECKHWWAHDKGPLKHCAGIRSTTDWEKDDCDIDERQLLNDAGFPQRMFYKTVARKDIPEYANRPAGPINSQRAPLREGGKDIMETISWKNPDYDDKAAEDLLKAARDEWRKNIKAHIVGSYDYGATFYTSADFFCANFEEK